MYFIITTSPIVENHTIIEYLGPIISNEVLGVSVISDSIASFSDFFGGTSGTYRGKLEDLKKTVLNDLKNQALTRGADAIIGFNIAFNEISGKGKQMFMATATGTAVKLGQNRMEYARKMLELKTFLKEGILSDIEYEHEVQLLKSNIINVVAIEAEQIEKQKKITQELAKRNEEISKQKQERILKAIVDCDDDISDLTEYGGFKKEDFIEVTETGDMTTIDGFSKNGKIICTINGEVSYLDLEDVKLVLNLNKFNF